MKRPATFAMQSGVAAGRSRVLLRLTAASIVTVGTLLAAATLPLWRPADADALPLAAAVAALALAAFLHPIEPAPGEKLSLSAAAVYFGVRILPPPLAVAAAVTAALSAKVAQRRTVMNTAVNVAQIGAASAISALVGLSLPAPYGLLAGATAYAVTTLGLVSLMIVVAQGSAAALGFLGREWLPTVSLVAVGALGAVVWSMQPIALVLVAPALAMIELSSRRAARSRVAPSPADGDALAAEVAHELRSKLTALSGNLAYVISAQLAPDEQRALADARGEADRLTSLVSGLLTLARTQGPRLEGRSVLADRLRSALETLPPLGARTLEVDVPRALALAVPAELVETALHDLLDNALRYAPGGTISVRARSLTDRAEITITDTGIGIPADELPHVVERFYRGAAARELAAGTGLGLSIVQRVVVAYGGSLRITSTLGKGTTVVVTLPLA